MFEYYDVVGRFFATCQEICRKDNGNGDRRRAGGQEAVIGNE
jgi:hypothetical protein